MKPSFGPALARAAFDGERAPALEPSDRASAADIATILDAAQASARVDGVPEVDRWVSRPRDAPGRASLEMEVDLRASAASSVEYYPVDSDSD